MHKNLSTFIWFELFYKLAGIFVVLPVIVALLYLVMFVTGHPYLAPDNIGSFLPNPLVWLWLIIAIIILTAYTMFDVATVIVIFDQSKQNKKIKIWPAICAGAGKFKGLVNRHNILLPLVVLVLLPFLSLGIAFGINRHLALPEFIGNFIENNTVLAILTGVAIIALTVLVIRWMYAFHYYVLENLNFKQARKKSTKLIKGYAGKDFLWLIAAQVVYLIGVGVVVLAGLGILWGLNQLLQFAPAILDWLNPVLMGIIMLVTMILSLMAVPFIYGLISWRFYQHKRQRKEAIKHYKLPKKDQLTVAKSYSFAVGSIAILIIGGVLYYTIGAGQYTLSTERSHPVEVTAHRGFSAEYPENTMSAFRGAVENGADWVELDVQQTKDHKIVISHDNDTERMTGVYKDIWDTDYAELAKLDFGSKTDPKFAGEKIATLAEVLEFANKTEVRLNIEIKRNGHDDGIEENVVKLIRQYHQENSSMISSLSYDTLKTVKAIDPDIKTLYVMLFAYGAVDTIPDIDGYSVEATSVTSKLISDVHKKGSEVMAWTIDDESNMRRLDNMSVDNIITNQLLEAKETLADNADANPYTNFWTLIEYALNL